MVPPITRDNTFYCCDASSETGFYIELTGDANKRHCHIRAPPSRLRVLLLEQTPQTKDESDHFYTAQLMHYGLKPLKTKAAAKKSLVAALENGKLLVPGHLEQLRRELQAEYAKLYAEAVQMYALDNSMHTLGLGQTTAKQTAKKSSAAPKISSTASISRELPSHNDEPTVAPRYRAKQTAVRGTAFARMSGRSDNGSGSSVQSRAVGSNGPKEGKASSSRTFVKDDTQGEYAIKSDDLHDESPPGWAESMCIKMCPSEKTKRHLWASFDFGVIRGIMRGGPAPTKKGAIWHFNWRGTVGEEHEQAYGPRNIGTITFLGNGQIWGTMSGTAVGLNTVFSGSYVKRPNVVWVKSVAHWKDTWRGINDVAYERENIRRWGKWASDEGTHEQPAASDSSGDENVRDDGEYDGYDEDMDIVY
ncbi:hypothetical protein CALVIDRAFT_563983 [Calocera viscosa TUFC12733]|uniref:Uncharacterized protein n=1 Tax=Calocera viscosa (strain TUFC12733) TaxID=1330018 RepID=A0A167MAK7_CALVF|nr:hypothetical protein CALVIDRAFT_563983 [Calocera viscosa TUFC12733]